MEPIIIDYEIKVDQGFNTSQFAYDIEVELDEPVKHKTQFVKDHNLAKEINTIEDNVKHLFTCNITFTMHCRLLLNIGRSNSFFLVECSLDFSIGSER